MHRIFIQFLTTSILLVLLIVSCGHNGYPRILYEADRLTEENPDSALRLLRSVEKRMDAEPEATRMYWRLLVIKASDKAYQPLCKPDEMLDIVDYYDGGGDKELLPEALYYAGRVYRTANDAPRASQYFMEALRAIDASSSPEDFARLKGKCFSQLGSVYLYQDLCAEAIEKYQQAFNINNESDDTVGMVFNLRDVANTYLSMSKPDSSLIYCNRGINLASSMRDTLFLHELYLLKVVAQIEKGDYKLANEDYQKAQKFSGIKPTMAQYTIGARLSYSTGDTSECQRMSMKMLNEGNLHDKRWASKTLAELALKSNKPQQAMDFINQYISLDDSVSKIDRAQTIIKMNTLYDYTLRENENTMLKARNTKLIWLVVAAIIMLASFSLAAIFYMRYKRQQHALMKLKIDKLEAMRSESASMNVKRMSNNVSQIEASDIYQQICRNINDPSGPAGLSSDEWKQVTATLQSIYPDFENSLLSLCRMNDNEMKVCQLLKMGFTPSNIAALTCHSKESVSATRRRLFEKAFGQKRAPSEWDSFIRAL